MPEVTAADRLMTEKRFQGMVEQLAKTLGWKIYHPWRSFHSVKGYPDLTLVKELADGRAVLKYAELKTETGKLTPDQQEWLIILNKVPGVRAYVWRPSQFEDIARILQGRE